MSGVVAAGEPETAAAGAEILRMGGNAVDAAIAASLAAFVAESVLASAGGSGVMTIALPGQEPAAIDFFSDMPGLGLGSIPGRELDFLSVHIDFGPVRQEFHIGRGSAAVPGALPGLAEAHRAFGSLPLSDLVAPAIRLANHGFEVRAVSQRMYSLIWPILTYRSETAEAVVGGRLPGAGDRLRNPLFGEILREFGELGRMPDRMIEGILQAFSPAQGGLITEDDIRAYRPRIVPPRHETLEDWSVYSAPVPGGTLAMVIFQELAGGMPSQDDSTEVLRFARASRAGHARREAVVQLGSTTHISVVDTQGGAAAVTLTNGEGAGYLIPHTGIQINNFLGEEDLNPHGFHRHQPGRRLPTMMAPSVGLRSGVPALALGSGGSNRIRSAVSEVLYRITRLGQSIEDAVAAPRVHAEGNKVWVELEGLRDPDAALAALKGEFDHVHAFSARDFFFGGVHTVALDQAGRPHGVGDLRRGGVAATP